MTDLILHEYQVSPFSEKARRLFAFKKLPYQSVRVPAVMPKPDVLALTGGYRKTPVLQIGNHVYCDTSLIAKVLEARQPTPTLYPTPVAEIVAEWADTSLFEVTAPIGMRPTRFDNVMQYMTQEEVAKLGPDRAAMRQDAGRRAPGFRACQAHLDAYLSRLDASLAHAPYLFGTEPCIADFSVYASVWFLETLAPEPLSAFGNVQAWSARIRAIPGIEPTTMESSDALALCKRGPADYTPETPFFDVASLERGATVGVRATDYGRDPTFGTLAHATRTELVIRREDERAGTVFVHFPRVGFETVKP
jgi:glutathione S-transferase